MTNKRRLNKAQQQVLIATKLIPQREYSPTAQIRKSGPRDSGQKVRGKTWDKNWKETLQTVYKQRQTERVN